MPTPLAERPQDGLAPARAPPFRPPIPLPPAYDVTAGLGPVGHLRHIRRVGHNPLEIWTERHFELDYAAFRLFGKPCLLVNAPEGVRRVFLTRPDNYGMNRMRQTLLRPFLRDGLLTAEGEIWKTARRAVSPAFTPRRLDGFAPGILSAIDIWTERLAAQAGETVSISDAMVDMTLDVLIATLFSGEDDLDKPRFSENVRRLMEIGGRPHPFDLLNLPKALPRIGQLKKDRHIRDLRAQVGEIRDRRRNAGAPRGEDFLSLLLGAGLPDEALIDNLLTFLVAGHETTARSLSWTFYLLSQAPEDGARLEAEIDAADLDPADPQGWIDALPFTHAVIKESLRLFPSAAHLPRTALGPDAIGGHKVEAGTGVIISPWLLHRHRKLWADPDAFRPQRFLGEAGAAIPRGAFIPFGLGPRVCIGGRFAMMEMVIALARLAGRMRFELATEGYPLPVLRITLAPDRDMKMRVRLR